MLKRGILIICLIGLLLIAPVCAKEITSKVDDKRIIDNYGSAYYIHTVDFGDISVREEQYQQVMINDTVTFNTGSDWGVYTVLKINGEDVYV